MSDVIQSVDELDVGDAIGPGDHDVHVVTEIEDPNPDAGLFDNKSGSVTMIRKGRKLLPSADDDWSADGEELTIQGDSLTERGWENLEVEV